MLVLHPVKWVRPFSFDGNGYVSIPDSPLLDSLTTSITIEAWIKVNQFDDFRIGMG